MIEYKYKWIRVKPSRRKSRILCDGTKKTNMPIDTILFEMINGKLFVRLNIFKPKVGCCAFILNKKATQELIRDIKECDISRLNSENDGKSIMEQICKADIEVIKSVGE